MEEILKILEHWAWLIKLAATLTAIGTIYKYVFKPIKLFIIKFNETINNFEKYYPILEKIANDFIGEEGHSLKKSIEKINETLCVIENKNRIVSEFNALVLIETNADGKCTWVNYDWCKLTKISLQEALGNGWIASVNSIDREDVFKEWDNSIKQKRQFLMKFRMGENGDTIFVQMLALPFKNEKGDIIGFLGKINELNK